MKQPLLLTIIMVLLSLSSISQKNNITEKTPDNTPAIATTYGVNTVTIELLFCEGGLPEGIEVTLEGLESPYQYFFAVSDTTGIVVFDNVNDGLYNLYAYSTGHYPYEHRNLTIDTNIHYEIVLDEIALPPQNLIVDPLTSVATWDDPTILKLPKETFESDIFPPANWQATSLGEGWFRSNDGGSSSWNVPSGDGYYAISNDNNAGISNNGSNDYLITPLLDLSDCISYQINFDYFYDGTNGQSAYIEYSLDNGITWEVIDTLDVVSNWANTFADLMFLSGPNTSPVLIAFHSDDNSEWASGLCIDNVEVISFPNDVIGYYVYLDDIFVASTPPSVKTHTYIDLNYGQTYTASIRSLNCSELSEPTSFTFESTYLHPPRNLTNNYTYGTDSVQLQFNPPQVGTIPLLSVSHNFIYDGLDHFKIYSNNTFVEEIPYENQSANEWIYCTINDIMPGSYQYCVSAVYDLTTFGFPGQYDESQLICCDSVDVIYGSIIPFFENWDSETFEGWPLNENPDNWLINTNEGEPAPSAQFYSEPTLENGYTSTLTSNPIIVDSITEGDIFLSFDLKLIDRNSTGNEKLLVEILDDSGWNIVAEYANSGKTDFESNNINISEFCDGNTIQIRFNVTGQNSNDIESWFIDNIEIIRECTSPYDLVAKYVWNTQDDILVELNWEMTANKLSTNFNNSQLDYKLNNSNRDIQGFNIYRMNYDSSNYSLYDFVDVINGQSSYSYFDEYPNIDISTGYYYKVTATYTSNIDYCESNPAQSYENPENDFVYVFITGELDNYQKNTINIFPNPVNNILNINSLSEIENISLINNIGQIILQKENIKSPTFQINTYPYHSGIYILQVETKNEKIVKQIVIN